MKSISTKKSISLLFGCILLLLPGLTSASEKLEEQILEKTNEARIEQGLEKLQENVDLKAAAQMKIDDMLKQNYFAHTSPLGTTPWYFLNQVDYQFSIAGENLAKDYFSPQIIVDAWLDSSEHRDNLLNPDFKEIGIAMDTGNVQGQDTTLVVQMFGNREDFVATDNSENEIETEHYIQKPKIKETKNQVMPVKESFNITTWLIVGFLVVVLLFIIPISIVLFRKK